MEAIEEQECCSVCKKISSSLEGMHVPQIMDLLKLIIAKVNSKLLEEFLICPTCLSKLREAYKFKISYLETSQKTSFSRVKENPDTEECMGCEICKKFLGPNDCVPLFDSVTETGLSLMKYFSTELESKAYKDFFTCEVCHKSLIKFYNFTNLLSNYDQDHIDQVSKSDNGNVKEEPEKIEDEYNTNADETFTLESKEMSNIPEAVKDEIEIEESCLKDEAFEFKMEEEETVEVERFHYAEDIKIFHPIKCKLCDAVFDNNKKYMKHYDKCHVPKKTEKFLCDICGKQFSLKHRFMRHRSVHINRTYICETCGLSFDNKNKWITHRWTHAEETKLKCDRCNKKFANNISVREHIKRVHYPEENNVRFQCEECGRLLKNKTSLLSHLRMVHSTSGPCRCPNCPKVFSTSFYLSRHMKRTCKKPAKVRKRQCCKICGKYYKKSGNLKTHEKSHLITRRWECNKCGITLKNFQTLKKHEKTHINGENMHRCNVCWKKFETVENLEEHMILHNRPQHQCEECGESFHRKFLLDNHILLDHSVLEYVEYVH